MTRIVLLAAACVAGVACGSRDQEPPRDTPSASAISTPAAPVVPAPPPRPAITGIDWFLKSIADRPVVHDSGRVHATLRFESDSASAFGGCNRFGGKFTRRGDSLWFEAMSTSKDVCAPPIMQAELAYLAVIPNVRTYAIHDSVLTLSGVTGPLARFVKRVP